MFFKLSLNLALRSDGRNDGSCILSSFDAAENSSISGFDETSGTPELKSDVGVGLVDSFSVNSGTLSGFDITVSCNGLAAEETFLHANC